MKPIIIYLKAYIRKNILFRAFKRYQTNNNLIRADAIAYSIVLSIIPLFTVLVKYAEVDQDTIRLYTAQFMAAYGIPDSAELILVLDGILKRADAIAGIGTIFAVFGATNALRHLETSFNSIYQAKSRPLLYRFSLHISAIIIIPAVAILLGSFIIFLVRSAEPPGFMSMSQNNRTLWIATNRGYLLKKKGSLNEKIDLSKKIETGSPFRDIYFDTSSGRSGTHWELNLPAPEDGLGASDFLRLKKITAQNQFIYVITDNGIVFFSDDDGANWNYITIRILAKNSFSQQPITEDILIDQNNNIYFLTSTSKGSQLIRKDPEGNFFITSFRNIYKRITFLGTGSKAYPAGFYLTGSGIFTYSEDGMVWSRLYEASYANRKPRINSIVSNGDKAIIFAGNNGALWSNEEGKNYYPDFRSGNMYFQQSLYGVVFFNPEKGILYGNHNLFRYTMDGGRTWLYPENEILSKISFFSHVLIDDKILIVGENETLLSLKNPTITASEDEAGKPRVHFDVEILDTRSPLFSFLYNISAYFIIFILFFIFFTFLYMLLPNASVYFSAAVLGSSFTSSALILFLIGIRLWWLFFSRTAYIYGIWAVIPMGMLMLLVFLQIILYGLELSYLYQKEKSNLKESVNQN